MTEEVQSQTLREQAVVWGPDWSYTAAGPPLCPTCQRDTQRYVHQYCPAHEHPDFGRVYGHRWKCRACGLVFTGFQPAPALVLTEDVYRKYYK